VADPGVSFIQKNASSDSPLLQASKNTTIACRHGLLAEEGLTDVSFRTANPEHSAPFGLTLAI
jgi:hypothetical protein